MERQGEEGEGGGQRGKATTICGTWMDQSERSQ